VPLLKQEEPLNNGVPVAERRHTISFVGNLENSLVRPAMLRKLERHAVKVT
jgi:hypothetical protein